MNPGPVAVYLDAPTPAALYAEALSRMAIGLKAAVFWSGAAALSASVPHSSVYRGSGGTQETSAHVSSPFLPSRVDACGTVAKEAWFRMPQVGPADALKATGTPCVSSNTESIAPAAPHLTRKSAARTTLASAPSQIRPGEFGTVLYDWMFAIVTPVIAPAVCVMFGTFAVLLQTPADGAQLPPLGFGVFSLVPPVHHRGPLNE